MNLEIEFDEGALRSAIQAAVDTSTRQIISALFGVKRWNNPAGALRLEAERVCAAMLAEMNIRTMVEAITAEVAPSLVRGIVVEHVTRQANIAARAAAKAATAELPLVTP